MASSSRISVVLVAVLVPLVAAVAVFAVTLYTQYGQTQRTMAEALTEDAWQVAQPVRDAVTHIHNHARTLASAVATLYPALEDPLPTVANLLRREITSEPLYDQLRLIGPPPAARELVRFNQLLGHIERVPPDMLQPKGHRDYYQAAAALPMGSTDLSITLNREFGQLQAERPMLRAATPVHLGGQLLGVVVINVDFQRLLQRLESGAVPHNTQLHIADARGYRLAHPDPAMTFGFDRNADATMVKAFPFLAATLAGLHPGDTRTLHHGDGWLAVHRIALRPGGDETLDILLTRADPALGPTLLAGAGWASLVTLPLMALAGLAAMILRRRFVTPLLTVAAWADRVERGDYSLGPLPRGAEEVRRFAGKFTAMVARLARRERDYLRRNQELETLFEAVPSPMLMLDERGDEQALLNPAAADLLGNLAPRQAAFELVHGGETLAPAAWPWNRARDAGEATRGEEYTLLVEGRPPRFLLVNAVPLYDEQHHTRGAVAVLTDVSERHAFEQSLLAGNRRLTRLNQELEQFAFAASHDLKGPLRGVSHLVTLFREQYAEHLDDDGRDWLRQLQQRAERMHALLEGLLRYAQVGSEAGTLETVDSAALVAAIIGGLAAPAGMTITMAPGLPTLRTDPLRLRRVLGCLLENAVRHHDRPSGGHVRVAAELFPDGWRFSVGDDGPGVPEHAREMIFRIFYTLSGDPSGSHGVGLAIVAKLVREQGGSFGVEALEPRGARFWFVWPEQAGLEGHER